MGSQTCGYVASKYEPEEWHGTHPSQFWLDRNPENGGLGIFEWYCPHPPFEEEDADEEDDDEKRCVFHTDANVSANRQRTELLDALDDAGEGPCDDRPEHRGQFVGATFGAIDLSDNIIATGNHDIRFDHTQFQADGGDLNFTRTTFITQGQHPVSFVGAEFMTDGDGDVQFHGATFRAFHDGHVWFHNATFRTDGDGHVLFPGATFRADVGGDVRFTDATFRADSTGNVWFPDAIFRADGGGDVQFHDATFGGDSTGNVNFQRATFRTNGSGSVLFNKMNVMPVGDGDVDFRETTFETGGDGNVDFDDVVFRASGSGCIRFNSAMFRAADNGSVQFEEATLTDTEFWDADFGGANLRKADLRGATLTRADLRQANIEDVSVNGATTCKRLNEGYGTNHITGKSLPLHRRQLHRMFQFGKRLSKGSEFDPQHWDATAMAYHDLKTVFSGHGLVGKARAMHIRERRARSLEPKAASGWVNFGRYLGSLPSRFFTGYGIQIRNLVIWMVVLFLFSTWWYVNADVNGTLMANNVFYSVLAFTVAPPPVEGLEPGTKIVVMFETFFGTLSIVLLGYILGNRERF